MKRFWYFTAFCLIIIGVAGTLTFDWNSRDKNLKNFEKEWTFNAADLRKLDIVSDYDVKVTFVKSTDGQNSIRLTGHGTEKMVEKTLATEISSQSLQLDLTRMPKKYINFFDFNFAKTTEEFVISVADDALLETLKLELDSGNIELTDVAIARVNDAELSVDSGNLTLNNFKSDRLDIEIDSGNIHGDGVSADLTASADSGNIKLENMSGRANIGVDSGTVKLYRLDTADTDISADSGNVFVQVPSSFAGFYDLQVDSGTINSPESKRQTKDYVKVRADSGNITIEER